MAGDETEVFLDDPKTKCTKTLTVEKSILQKHSKCRYQDWRSKPSAFLISNTAEMPLLEYAPKSRRTSSEWVKTHWRKRQRWKESDKTICAYTCYNNFTVTHEYSFGLFHDHVWLTNMCFAKCVYHIPDTVTGPYYKNLCEKWNSYGVFSNIVSKFWIFYLAFLDFSVFDPLLSTPCTHWTMNNKKFHSQTREVIYIVLLLF